MEKNITKLFLPLAAFIITAAFTPAEAHASVITHASSAKLAGPHTQTAPKQVVIDNRAKILKKYLESYNSPLSEHAETFVREADKHGLDWKLVPAITGVESYFGQMIPPYSYNGWGYHVYNGNVRGFASWDEGIEVVTNDLREVYMDQWGAQNVYQIGSHYAADPLWPSKVTRFMNELETFEQREKSKQISLSV